MSMNADEYAAHQSAKDDRRVALQRTQALLNTSSGQEFVEELRVTWDQHLLIGESPEITAYNVGLRDAFKFVEGLQKGAYIGD